MMWVGRMGCAVLLLATVAPAQAERQTRLLASGWQFRFGAAGPWSAVTVPHSWNRLGGTAATAADRDVRRGAGWYRLAFDAAAPAAGRRTVLQFDGASIVTDAWLNGVPLGRHAGAYSRFRFDISTALKTGANELLVRTDNSPAGSPDSPTREVIPLSGDWFMFGGLYRAVSLIETDAIHVDLLDHGSSGLSVRTVNVTPARAQVTVQARLRNDGATAGRGRMVAEIRDARGAVVARADTPFALDPQSARATAQTLDIATPHLWDGVRDPYLYSVRVTVSDMRGRPLDSVEQPLGVRTMRLDPDRGFLLNGRAVPLHGVALHQDRAGKGWAVSPTDRAQDFALIRELGANTVRLSHYQHDEQAYQLADRLGLVLWTEIPFVNRASPEGSATTTPALRANAETQLRELIRQTGNHPSVAVWGIGNEVNFDAAFKRSPTQALPLLATLDALAKAEDPSRPTVLADCCGAVPGEGPAGSPVGPVPVDSVITAADAYAVNRYYGWYGRDPAFLGADLDRLRSRYPGRAQAVSEYGAGGALTQHSDNPDGGPINAFGRPHPEEVQARLHERWWPQLEARPRLWGTWVWNMFDFASEQRAEGDLVDTNDKGLVTYDRAIRKDAFYYYKALWNPEPIAYLTGRRNAVRAVAVADVKAYSNAPRLTLRIDGRLVGDAECPGRICLWRNVPLAPGDNRLTVSGTVAGRPVADAISWRRPLADILYAIPAGVLAASGSADRPIGSDTLFEGGVGHNLAVSGRPMPGPFTPMTVSGAPRPELIGGWRSGRFRYVLPAAAGRYRLRLHFFEPAPETAVGGRVFDVVVNDRTLLSGFDIRREAGAAARVVLREFTVRPAAGQITVAFRPVRGDAVLSAIELVRQE